MYYIYYCAAERRHKVFVGDTFLNFGEYFSVVFHNMVDAYHYVQMMNGRKDRSYPL